MGYAVFTVESVINLKTGHMMFCRVELGLEAWRKEMNGMFAHA
jgi:hypothetical protein